MYDKSKNVKYLGRAEWVNRMSNSREIKTFPQKTFDLINTSHPVRIWRWTLKCLAVEVRGHPLGKGGDQ